VTQFRNVSGVTPTRAGALRRIRDQLPGIDYHPDRLHPKTSGYFLGAAMHLILPWDESLRQTRHGQEGAEERDESQRDDVDDHRCR